MIIVALSAYAQKPKLGKVEGYIKSGSIAEAKDMIDLAVDYEKTKDSEKTYYLRGLVYAIIDTSSVHNGLADNPMDIALESFAKAEELSPADKEPFLIDQTGLPVTMSQHLNQYWAFYYNQGAQAYGNGEWEAAVAGFTKAQMVLPNDTNAYMNAGLAAQNGQDLKTARANYEKAIEAGIKSADIFNLLVYIVGTVDEEPEKAYEIVQKGREFNPDNNDLARSEISLLIAMEKVDEARQGLMTQIESEPNDPNLHFTLGILYEELAGKAETDEEKAKQMELAMNTYKEAIRIDQNYYNAQYNIGVILITQANEVIKERNELGVSREDLKKADELAPVIEERLKTALPQWETIYSIRSDERAVLETLSYLYQQLKMYDKQEEIMALLDQMPDEEEEE